MTTTTTRKPSRKSATATSKAWAKLKKASSTSQKIEALEAIMAAGEAESAAESPAEQAAAFIMYYFPKLVCHPDEQLKEAREFAGYLRRAFPALFRCRLR